MAVLTSSTADSFSVSWEGTVDRTFTSSHLVLENGRATAVEERPGLCHLLDTNSQCQREKENNRIFLTVKFILNQTLS